ncbi:hypothetical protein [Amycolatopsis sp. RTGN1]|uniref:hypothetical protein n=1 Tax=Amycolatopsis ponsaeliensis TaxID=2992142 RepID=UPI00254C9154|nr:hypothetical protein [Amycolatopsis sp. RTGN1]
MDQTTLPDDPLGPPLLGRTTPPGVARSQALTGHHAPKDGFGTLTTFTTIGSQPADS